MSANTPFTEQPESVTRKECHRQNGCFIIEKETAEEALSSQKTQYGTHTPNYHLWVCLMSTKEQEKEGQVLWFNPKNQNLAVSKNKGAYQRRGHLSCSSWLRGEVCGNGNGRVTHIGGSASIRTAKNLSAGLSPPLHNQSIRN